MPAATLADRRDSLARIPLFSRLEAAELDGLLRYSRSQRLAKGEELFHKGDPGSDVYVILSGRLKASTPSGSGSEVTFSIMDPGEVCGELAMLSGEPRSATIEAVEPCELLALGRREFMQFLREQPDVGIKLMGALAGRLQRVSELVEDTLFLNLPARLAKKLLALRDAYGEPTAEGVRIDLKLSQQDLGEMVGTTRESINKQIRAWESEGVLAMARGRVTILDVAALESLAGALP